MTANFYLLVLLVNFARELNQSRWSLGKSVRLLKSLLW